MLIQLGLNASISECTNISTSSAQEIIFHVLYRPPNVQKAQFLEDLGYFLKMRLYQLVNIYCWVI